jgi:FkbM family methyltransferase
MTGPILISEIVFKNTDKVYTPEFGVCGGYDGYGIRDFYKDEKMQLDPKICIVHLFAVACNKFANLFDNINSSSIKSGNSLLARTIKSILTSEEYDPFKKVFVEIGSNYFDTLVHLAKDNWRGVIVEAVPEYFDKIEKVEGVSYENVVIGDKIGNVPFYYIPQETIIEKKLPDWARGLGSLNKKHPIVTSNGWENLVKEIIIPMITVKALLDKHSINHIDYLKIDTEGSDCDILQKFDLSKIDKMVFEHKHCSKEDVDKELKRLEEYGFKYEFVGDNVKASKRSELMLNSKKKYRFHLLGLVHLPCSKKYMSCAFTQKNWKLAKMLLDLGHEVYYYGAEGSELPCTEFIQTHTLADIRKEWGDGDNRFEIGYDWPKTDFRHDFNTPKTETTKKFYETCIKEINDRKKEDDFLLITQGCYQIPIRNGVKLFLNCEPGIGYRGSVEGNYRAFESSYIQNFTYGSQHPYECINGSYYDRVIPNYFDEKDVEFNADTTGDYFFFIGRMIRRKGIIVAHMAAKALGKKLIIAGQGAEVKDGHLVSEDFNLEPGTWEYVGYANVEQRKELMKNAIATFTPTEYLECFAGTHIETMLHGTPAITTDFGVFPGTVINGVNGFRCSTLDDFVNAAKNADKIDRTGCRKSAERYLMDYVKWEYQKWFDDLYAVYESAIDKSIKGWSRIREEDSEWRKKLTC